MISTGNIVEICNAKRFNINEATAFLGSHTEKIAGFVDFALQNNDKSWHATWTLTKLDANYTFLVQPYCQLFIDSLATIKKHGQLRETLKLISKLMLTEEQTCTIIDFCFACINNNKMQGSVKSIAMNLILRIGRTYPELQNEAIEIFKTTKEYYTSGMRSSISNQIQKVQKLKLA